MTDSWRTVRLEDLADDVTVGHVGPMADEYQDTGIPFLRSLNVEPYRINMTDLKFVDPSFSRKLRKSRLHPGDVVIVRTGKPGACAVIPPWLPDANCSDLVIVRPGKGLDARFFMYFVNSAASEHVAAHLVGAVQQHFNVASARQMQVFLPNLPEQRAIAHILGTLDDKIELNRKMNKTLDEIARTLFISWFIDFDPVRAKAEGRQPEGMDAGTAALFPDRFADSELGPIPEGWEAGTIGDVLDNPRHLVSPDRMTQELAYIGLEHMPRHSISLGEWGDAGKIESTKFGFSRGDILFGKLRPYFHKVGIAPISGVCSTDILVLTSKQGEWSGFCIGHMSSEAIINFADAGSEGTRMPRTSWERLSAFAVALPPHQLAATYERTVKPFFDSIVENIHQSRTLAELRDTLLPALMAGPIHTGSAIRTGLV